MTEKTTKVLSKGANDLVKALNLMKQLSSNVEAMSNEITDLDYQIAEKEKSLTVLQEQYNNSERQALLELDLKVKEGMKKHVGLFLTELNQLAVDKDTYNRLLEIESRMVDMVEDEKAKIRTELSTKFQNELNLKLAQINAERAQDKADLKNMQDRLAEATRTANLWKEQLEAERNASVERSKAASIGSLTVNPSK